MARVRERSVDWRGIYRNSSGNVWESHPHEYSKAAVKLVGKGVAIDIGCGEGYDALYLAGIGFKTLAVDISPKVLKRMDDVARIKSLPLHVVEADVNEYRLAEQVDLLCSYGVLHFLGENAAKVISHYKEMTKNLGVHALYLFGNDGDFFDIAHHKFWFPDQNEIRAIYSGWQIHSLEQKTVEMLVRGDNGEALHNSMLKVLAQKV